MIINRADNMISVSLGNIGCVFMDEFESHPPGEIKIFQAIKDNLKK